LGRRHFLPSPRIARWRRGHRAAAVRISRSRSDGATVSGSRIRAAHHQPATAFLLQAIAHLHALLVVGAFRCDLNHSIGFIAVELERGHGNIHILIAETGLGEMIQNALMDCFPILISAAATGEG